MREKFISHFFLLFLLFFLEKKIVFQSIKKHPFERSRRILEVLLELCLCILRHADRATYSMKEKIVFLSADELNEWKMRSYFSDNIRVTIQSRKLEHSEVRLLLLYHWMKQYMKIFICFEQIWRKKCESLRGDNKLGQT